MTKLSILDRLVWRLFFWRWNDILMNDPHLAKKLGLRMMMFSERNDK